MQFFIARGGQNLCCPIPWELAWGLMYEKSVFKRVIKGGRLLFVFVIKWLIILGLFDPPVRTLRFFRKYPFSAFKHCHAYSIIIVVFLQEIIR